MNKAQKLYAEAVQIGGDVAYLANCILTGATKPATKLRKLLALVREGRDVRTGNLWGEVRIDGVTKTFSHLDG